MSLEGEVKELTLMSESYKRRAELQQRRRRYRKGAEEERECVGETPKGTELTVQRGGERERDMKLLRDGEQFLFFIFIIFPFLNI